MAKRPAYSVLHYEKTYHNQYRDVKFIYDNPIPRNSSFEEIWDWFGPLQKVERRKIK